MSTTIQPLETYNEEYYWIHYISQVFELNNKMYAEFEFRRSSVPNLDGITYFKTPVKFPNGYILPVIPKKRLLQYIDKYIIDNLGQNKPYFISIKTDVQKTGNDILMVHIIQNLGSLQMAHTSL